MEMNLGRRQRSFVPGNTNARLVLSATTLSTAGDAAFAVGLVWWLISGGATGSLIGLTNAAGLVVLVIAAPFSGRLLDRRNRRSLMIAADIFRAAVLTVLVCALLFSPKVARGWAIPLTGAIALGTSLFTPGLGAVWKELSPAEELVRLRTFGMTAQKIGAICGAAGGGLLISAGGFSAVTAADIASFLASALLLKAARFSLPRMPHPAEDDAKPDRAVVRFILRDPRLATAVAVAFVANFATALFAISIPLVAATLGATGSQYGLLQGCYQGGMLAAGAGLTLAMTRCAIAITRARITQLLVCLGAAYGLLGAARTFPAAIAACLLAGMALIATSALADTALLASIPEAIVGRVLGYVVSISGAMRPLGQASGGVLADATSPSTVALVAALTCAALALGVARWGAFTADVTGASENGG